MRAPQSIWSKLDRFPPVLVRLLARDAAGRALADVDISTRSGLSLAMVKLISYSPTWNSVTVDQLRRFTIACGVDFASREDMRNANRYLRLDPKFQHLRRARRAGEGFEQIKELLELYATTLQ